MNILWTGKQTICLSETNRQIRNTNISLCWNLLILFSKERKKVQVLVACVSWSCPMLWDPMEPARLLCPWNSPGRNTGVGCHALLQGIFLTQGLNPGLLHCRQILYQLSYQEHPMRGYQCFRFYQVYNYDIINRCFASPPPRPLLTCFAF